jgi:hypothetical protein
LETYRAARDHDEAFGILRDHTEAAGVFVLLLGNLGSHHTNIDLETFRGFALADQEAPFLVINDQVTTAPGLSHSCTSWRICGWERNILQLRGMSVTPW